ncbi:hypothetical protein FOPG_14854 [Fusarium oxysporum f. sp. conglutinans race 2 54008]|uniref:Uncharacterized protein n=1 Tax=Fusarium oxysporum f. sp. conglutinans race 2 54008 TaxID=1089457 RepID=X0I774_FUSOX|nr:hypothetical protein FOPG_14854 [Fusarium oxysporum f. sp. conglutinans race 2 54008]
MAGLTHDLLNIAYFAFGANGCFLVGTQWSRTRFGRITIHWKSLGFLEWLLSRKVSKTVEE